MMRFELNWLSIVLIYWAVINIVTFFLYGIDKWKAKLAGARWHPAEWKKGTESRARLKTRRIDAKKS